MPQRPAAPQSDAYLDRSTPDMFLKVTGLTGESTDKEYMGWSEIIAFSWSVKQPAGAHGAGGAGGMGGRADFSDFAVTKAVDKMSAKLAVFCGKGQHISEVKINVRRPAQMVRLYEIILSDVVVASVQQDAHPGGFAGWLPVEQVTFNYAKIKWVYTECDHVTAQPKGDHKGGWDLKIDREAM